MEEQSIIEKQSTQETTDTTTKKVKILLGVSGSVAAIKADQLAILLSQFAEVRIVHTSSSKHFMKPIAPDVKIFTDADEWSAWKQIKDPVLHIELRKWADILVIAPLSANTLAKMANGLCDNLLTCVVRAWDFKKPLIVAPAMNTHMWDHPFTAKHLKELTSLGVVVIPPIEKLLACGDKGTGAMAEPATIAGIVKEYAQKQQ